MALLHKYSRIASSSARIYVVANRSYVHHFTVDSEVRVRFAPSPTGHLHLGGLRTALYNYLFARSRNGKFILRIEDTDQSRAVSGATEKLIDTMEWCGLSFDEGPQVGGEYGPYVQSLRRDYYNEMIKILLQNGSAYHCFCSTRRLNLLRKDALERRETPKYDNKCRSLTAETVREKLSKKVPYCIRFKLENVQEPWQDIIYGAVNHNVAEIEGDPILMKSDGFPTYHFANVVDDYHMRITHVLRGVEWQVSTVKHLLMYKAFGWEPPKFGHLPVLLNKDGKKFSKRQDDLRVENFKDKGYFSEAVLNLLCPQALVFKGADTSGFNIQELIKHFQIEEMGTHSTQLDIGKIEDLNQIHLQQKLENKCHRKKLVQQLKQKLKIKYPERFFQDCDDSELITDDEISKHLVWASKDRISKLDDLLNPSFAYLWSQPSKNNLRILNSETERFNLKDILNKIIELVRSSSEENFTSETLTHLLRELSVNNKIKYGHLMKNLRIIISGIQEGPPVVEIMEILGKRRCEDRLQGAIKVIDT